MTIYYNREEIPAGVTVFQYSVNGSGSARTFWCEDRLSVGQVAAVAFGH